MTTATFNKIVSEQLHRCSNLLLAKEKEYALHEDRLSSFKKAGALLGETPMQAALGMLSKHLVSVSDMIQSSGHFTISQWDEKLTDSINYLLIMRAMIEEDA